MKLAVAVVTLCAFLAVAQARTVDFSGLIDLEDNTAYNYLAKIGQPLAEEIRKSEESPSRIVGGSPAELGALPYQAGLLAQFGAGQGVCGASLITSNRLVTAAHCWWDGANQATSFIVVLGSTTLFSGGTRLSTNQVVMHSNWMPALIRNDVLIIMLTQTVTMSNIIQTIALPSGNELNLNFVGETAVASGFGRTSDTASGGITTQQVLSQVTLSVISNNVCFLSFPGIVQSSNICTSGANGRSTCSGDSGGPLAVTRNGRPVLIGITSFGSSFGCEQGFPAAFARVTSFLGFINENL